MLLLRECGPTLKDVLSFMALPLYGESNAMGLIYEGENDDNLQGLMLLLVIPRSCLPTNLHVSWIQYFDEGNGSCSGLLLEALLAY